MEGYLLTNNLSAALGIVATLFQLYGYYLYAKGLLKNKKYSPNRVSWLIWTYGSAFEAITYVGMSGDIYKNIFPIACNIACIITCVIVFKKGRYRKLSLVDYLCFIIDIASILVWWKYQSATYAHLVVMTSVAVSYFPTLFSVWEKHTSENYQAWKMWNIGYALAGLVVLLRWNKWEDMVYPATYLFFGLMITAIIRHRAARY
jgi:hypothetical protein